MIFSVVTSLLCLKLVILVMHTFKLKLKIIGDESVIITFGVNVFFRMIKNW